MQAHIDPTTGDYDGSRISNLGNAVFLRLSTPLGSYWADRALGSRLHELGREKDLVRVERLAVQYAQSALKPLLDDGRADKVNVAALRVNGRLKLRVEVIEAGGAVNVFEHFVGVE